MNGIYIEATIMYLTWKSRVNIYINVDINS